MAAPAEPGSERCPICGAPAERGQLVCLECGSRVALTYRRPPSWRVPLLIAVVVVGLFLVGAVVAVAAIGDDARQEVAAAPPRPQAASARGDAAPKTTAAKALVRRGDLYAWPSSLEGFTVVINSAESRASAESFARSAARGHAAKIGVIRADDFRTLPKGFYVVFAGSYGSRTQADKATARLGARFSGAFTQQVRR